MSKQDHFISFRVTQDEADALARCAEMECRSQTSLIRAYIRSLQKKLAANEARRT
jgi:hypothetical protein